MIDHAFGGLGLHRVGLTVFSFNERAIRSYRSVGFVVEGRAREAIWREGRWWDEISMSILDGRLGGDAACRAIPRRPSRAESPSRGRRPTSRGGPGGGHGRALRAATMSSPGPGGDAARADVRTLIEAKGHVVDNARGVIARLDARSRRVTSSDPAADQFLADLSRRSSRTTARSSAARAPRRPGSS